MPSGGVGRLSSAGSLRNVQEAAKKRVNTTVVPLEEGLPPPSWGADVEDPGGRLSPHRQRAAPAFPIQPSPRGDFSRRLPQTQQKSLSGRGAQAPAPLMPAERLQPTPSALRKEAWLPVVVGWARPQRPFTQVTAQKGLVPPNAPHTCPQSSVSPGG